jgi:hypothetical protein
MRGQQTPFERMERRACEDRCALERPRVSVADLRSLRHRQRFPLRSRSHQVKPSPRAARCGRDAEDPHAFGRLGFLENGRRDEV